MNDWFAGAGLSGWKPLLGTLLMPPVPLLLLVLIGAAWLPRRRGLGWAVLLAGVVGLWAMCTTALGTALINGLTRPPPALLAAQIAGLARAPHTAILVLGAGRRLLAPEYGTADLKPMTLERLRYGLWLARQTRLPVGYSGGVGNGSAPGPTEAEIVGRVAERDFGQPLRWLEGRSRDTNENAVYSVAMLRADGITRIVLVTNDFHQRRALAAFERALKQGGPAISVIAAPMGMRPGGAYTLMDWLPTVDGFAMTRHALHEWLGRIAGA